MSQSTLVRTSNWTEVKMFLISVMGVLHLQSVLVEEETLLVLQDLHQIEMVCLFICLIQSMYLFMQFGGAILCLCQ